MLAFHIFAGSIVLLFGTLALSLRKGARLHRLFGGLFFIFMILLTSSAAFIADDPSIAISSTYFVLTSWVTVLRPERKTGVFEILAFLTIIVVSGQLFVAAMAASGFMKGAFYLFGSVAAIAAVLDLNMIVRGGLAGKHRIARHLWRVCYAFGGALASFSANTSNKWPDFIDGNFLIYLMLGIMVYWLIKVLFTNWLDKAKHHFTNNSILGTRRFIFKN